MQAICKNEDEGGATGETNSMGTVLCIERIGRCVEGKCIGGPGGGGIRVQISREELVKAAELRKLEQGERMIEEFVQEFKRTARRSVYEGRLLVEEFKRGINSVIRKKLIEAKNQPGSIE